MEYYEATLVEKEMLSRWNTPQIILTFKVVVPIRDDNKWELGGLYPIDIDDKIDGTG